MSGLQNGRSGRLHRSTSHGGSILGPTVLDTMARTRDESTQFLKGSHLFVARLQIDELHASIAPLDHPLRTSCTARSPKLPKRMRHRLRPS
jgi:hypothetical protein